MNKSYGGRIQLSPFEKFSWIVFNVIFGIIPATIYFLWVERNMDFRRPYPEFVESKIGAFMPEFPWVYFPSWSLNSRIVWNFTLLLVWGSFHSILAQPKFYDKLARNFPAPTLRSIYVIITGITSWIVMGLWQPTDFIIWNLIHNAKLANAVSFTLFSCFTFIIVFLLSNNLQFLEFFGFNQLLFGVNSHQESVGPNHLNTSGIHGFVRHPLHLLTLMTLIVTPFMTLDRLIFVLASVTYLVWAIPLEEAKLEKKFGPTYKQYKQNVPAVVPFLRSQ
jgi:protein-S-isoprenylcysteine O-methyltransferase Ste14